MNYSIPVITLLRNTLILVVVIFLYNTEIVKINTQYFVNLTEPYFVSGGDTTSLCENIEVGTLSVVEFNIPAEKSSPKSPKPSEKVTKEKSNVIKWDKSSDRLYGFNFLEVKWAAQKQKEINRIADKVKDAKASKFIKDNGVWVLEEAALNGILPSGKMAQGMLESAYGTSHIALNANNYFCIKEKDGRLGYKAKDDEYYCSVTKKEWHGKYNQNRCTENHKHTLLKSTFKIYETPWGGWRDHSKVLKGNPRYKKVVLADDFKAYSIAIGKSGYATDPKYGQKIKSIIVKYNLYELDNIILSTPKLRKAYYISKVR